MNAPFSNVTILGGGLLGGSLAMALGKLACPPRVRLWARQASTVEAALALGIQGATHDLAEAIATADLLVLAVPVGAMPGLVQQAITAGLPDGCLITDVGSVKQAPHETIPLLLTGRRLVFIGSHPMAGSERNGLAAVTPNLFQQAACLLTHDESTPADAARALEQFWQDVGCRTAWFNPADHDALVARISHLPHVVAASAARISLQNPTMGQFGGGGLRDTTRVASGQPTMWAEILLENRQALAGPLRETIADLELLLGHLDQNDADATRQWLTDAKRQRDELRPPTPAAQA